MKILLLGFLAFSGWSAGSTYIYVCILHGLCDETIVMPLEEVRPEDRHLDETYKPEETPKADAVPLPSDRTIYFGFDESDFSADAETDTFMDQSANYLILHPQAILSIIGHTDDVGTEEYNRALGHERADRIRQYAEEQGLNKDQIEHTSLGENQPADTAQTDTGRSKNRRVALTIKE